MYFQIQNVRHVLVIHSLRKNSGRKVTERLVIVHLLVLSFLYCYQAQPMKKTRTLLGCRMAHASCRNLQGFFCREINFLFLIAYPSLDLLNTAKNTWLIFNNKSSLIKQSLKKSYEIQEFFVIHVLESLKWIYYRNFIAIKLSPV